MTAYGSIEPQAIPGSPRRSRLVIAVAGSLALGAMAALAVINLHPSGPTALEQWRLGMPWEAYQYQPTDSPGWTEPLDDSMYEEATPGYERDNCIANPFEELPPGYLCSSVRFGAYLLDPSGSLYGRRIQWKVRDVVRKETGEEEHKVEAPAAAEEPHPEAKPYEAPHGAWSSPWSWMRPSLLPNTTVCTEAVEGFYGAISSPSNANLTLAEPFLADGFVYQGPETPLLPACVPAVGSGKQVVGFEAWSEAVGEQLDAFGPSNSTLGGIRCESVNTRKELDPKMKCVARHVCSFELKALKNETGGNVTLSGEIVDTFYFNKEAKIEWMKSDLSPSDFEVVK
eukprot:CAMPEP_0173441058 /NCGR_PEP_ID=MMETSP1357-20121228/23752_1 /TAXON_ID=77926 /ORGANISM="Hemiselmis rufescens, Strain PCC563" /LENGTH=340 /DNA_ID=CAMNT_0014406609 /DNA_START=19 /DNA_END=1041 /DNA_ORIENTATION=-